MDNALRMLSAFVKVGTNPARWYDAADAQLAPIQPHSSAEMRAAVSMFKQVGEFVWICKGPDDFRVFSCHGLTDRSEFNGLRASGVHGARVEGIVVPLTLSSRGVSLMLSESFSDTEAMVTSAFLNNAWDAPTEPDESPPLSQNDGKPFSPHAWLDRIKAASPSQDEIALSAGIRDFLESPYSVSSHWPDGSYLNKLVSERTMPSKYRIDANSREFLISLHALNHADDPPSRLARLLSAMYKCVTEDSEQRLTIVANFRPDVKSLKPVFPLKQGTLNVEIPAWPIQSRNDALNSFIEWWHDLTPAWALEFPVPSLDESVDGIPYSFLALASNSKTPIEYLTRSVDVYASVWDGCPLNGENILNVLDLLLATGHPDLLPRWERDIQRLLKHGFVKDLGNRELLLTYSRLRALVPSGDTDTPPLKATLSERAGTFGPVSKALAAMDTSSAWPRDSYKQIGLLLDSEQNPKEIGYLLAQMIATTRERIWLEGFASKLGAIRPFDKDAADIVDRLFLEPSRGTFDSQFVQDLCTTASQSRRLSPEVPAWQVLFSAFNLSAENVRQVLKRRDERLAPDVRDRLVDAYLSGKDASEWLSIIIEQDDIEGEIRKTLPLAIKCLFNEDVADDSLFSIYCSQPDVSLNHIRDILKADTWLTSSTPKNLDANNLAAHFHLFKHTRKWPSSFRNRLTSLKTGYDCDGAGGIKKLLKFCLEMGPDTRNCSAIFTDFINERVLFSGFTQEITPAFTTVVEIICEEPFNPARARDRMRNTSSVEDLRLLASGISSACALSQASTVFLLLLETLSPAMKQAFFDLLWSEGKLAEGYLAKWVKDKPESSLHSVLEKLLKRRQRQVPIRGFVRIRPANNSRNDPNDKSDLSASRTVGTSGYTRHDNHRSNLGGHTDG